MSNRSRLVSAALIGASLALLLGGGGTFYVGMLRTYGVVDCSGLTADECAFEHDISKSIGRFQLISGVALFVLGLALYVLTRRPSTPAAPLGDKQP
jgi:hypothetical protein